MSDHIARFEVLEKIGEGGMGAVFKARDPGINRVVAIKLLREGFDSSEMRERFMQEARSAGGLQNPNIVTIFELGEHLGAPFIVMEFVVGETMDRQIKRKVPLRLIRKLELMEALCSGLGYAHRSGIVHRDIKPANLIVSNDGILKILDFGIARVGNSELTKTGALIGTPNYMAPEQLMGEPVDRRADIFSVGVVFYELLSYQRAFPGKFTEAIARVLHREPEALSRLVEGLDPQIEATVVRALDKSADRRYQDLSDMRRDIVRIRQRLERDSPETLGHTLYDKTIIGDYASLSSDQDRQGGVDASTASRAAAEVEAAMQQFERGEAAQAIERLEAFEPQNTFVSEALAGLRERADGLERQAQRSAAVSRAVDAASNAFGRGDYDSAIRYADEALLVDERAVAARDLRRRARAALDEQRRLAELERRAGRAIAEARERFAAGERQAAIDSLTAFQPAHTAIGDALSELRAEAAAIEQRAQEERGRQRAEEERLRLEAAERQRVEEERLRLKAAERKRVEEERLRLEAAERQRVEEERLRLAAAERKRVEEERQRLEAAELQRVEEERLRLEAAERQRVEEERQRLEAAERQRVEEERQRLEAAALQRAGEERLRLEAADRQRVEEERLRLEAAERQRVEEERLRLEAAERKQVAEEKRRAEEAERKRVEARQLEEGRQLEEKRRLEEERRAGEERRLAEEQRVAKERTAKEEAARREDEAARERDAQAAREAEARQQQQREAAAKVAAERGAVAAKSPQTVVMPTTAVSRPRPAETVAIPTITRAGAQPARQPMAVRIGAIAAGIALLLAIGYGVNRMRTTSTTGARTDGGTVAPTTSGPSPSEQPVDQKPTPLTNPPVQPGPDSAAAAEVTPPPIPPPAGAALSITIDALPWANVEIAPVGQPAAGETRKGTTPYIVELPAGDYTVRLTNPQLARPVTQRITVGANLRRAFQFTLPGLDPDKIVEEILSK